MKIILITIFIETFFQAFFQYFEYFPITGTL